MLVCYILVLLMLWLLLDGCYNEVRHQMSIILKHVGYFQVEFMRGKSVVVVVDFGCCIVQCGVVEVEATPVLQLNHVLTLFTF